MSEKSQLRKAYMDEADKQIKASDKNYDQVISQSNANALSRGMGRSSYAHQTEANLLEDKTNAANDIKTSMQDAFIKAWLAYKQQQEQIQLQQAQLQLQRDQFNWQKSQASASASPYAKKPNSNPNNDQNPNSQTGLTEAEAYAADLYNRLTRESIKRKDTSAWQLR